MPPNKRQPERDRLTQPHLVKSLQAGGPVVWSNRGHTLTRLLLPASAFKGKGKRHFGAATRLAHSEAIEALK